ncbi:hypothetical protein U1Q18_008633 [Sarracenia purpurea var. burkii]
MCDLFPIDFFFFPYRPSSRSRDFTSFFFGFDFVEPPQQHDGQQSHAIFDLFSDTGGYRVRRKLQIRSSVAALVVVLRLASNSSPEVTDPVIRFIATFAVVASSAHVRSV